MAESTIKLNVELDKKKVPEKIYWEASDMGENKIQTNSFLLAVWENESKSTLKIDLWTKEMLADDMKKFIHQTMVSIADTLRNSVGEEKASKELEKFLQTRISSISTSPERNDTILIENPFEI